jgi:hypothetical protein
MIWLTATHMLKVVLRFSPGSAEKPSTFYASRTQDPVIGAKSCACRCLFDFYAAVDQASTINRRVFTELPWNRRA